jgi:DNA-binding CsgD family transcriptional regulator
MKYSSHELRLWFSGPEQTYTPRSSHHHHRLPDPDPPSEVFEYGARWASAECEHTLLEDSLLRHFTQKEQEQWYQQVLRTLTANEQRVILDYYGFGGEPMLLSQIGEKLNLSRERVRQIQLKALRKLRHSSRLRPLTQCEERIDKEEWAAYRARTADQRRRQREAYDAEMKRRKAETTARVEAYNRRVAMAKKVNKVLDAAWDTEKRVKMVYENQHRYDAGLWPRMTFPHLRVTLGGRSEEAV